MPRSGSFRVALAVVATAVGLALPAAAAHANPPAPTLTTPVDDSQTYLSTVSIGCTGAVALADITVYVDGVADPGAPSGHADAAGHCAFTFPVSDGDHTIAITETVAGSESNQSSTAMVHVRHSAPQISYPVDNGNMDPDFPFIQGVGAFAGGTVVMVVDGTSHTVTADSSGNFKYFVAQPLTQGLHTVAVNNVDAQSNAGPVSPTTTYAYLAPPTLTAPTGWTHPSVALNLTFSGVLPGGKVRLFENGTQIATATADPSGNGTVATPTLPTDGIHDYTAKQADTQGHSSVASGSVRAYIDTTSPPKPVLLTPASLLPPDGDGGYVTDADQIFVYSTDANNASRASVTMHWELDGVAQPPLGAIGDGTAQLSPQAPALFSQGAHTIRAQAVDEAGNTSPWSDVTDFVVDSIPPATIDLVSPAAISSDSSGILQLKTEADAVVTLSLDGGPVLHDTADNEGNVEFDVGPLADGDHSLDTTATDAAGNGGHLTLHFLVDTTPPQAPVVSSPANGDVVTVPDPLITFEADPDTDITVFVDGAQAGVVQTDGDGNATFRLHALADGPHSVAVRAIDQAQNFTDGTPVGFTVAVPVAPPPGDTSSTPPPGDGTSHTPLATALKLSNVRLSGSILSTCAPHVRRCHDKTAKLSLAVSAPATIKLTLTRTVHHRTTTAATATFKVPKAGAASYVLHRKVGSHTLAHGSYKLVIQATAKSGGARSATVTESISVR